jgi:hypothetical protein
VSREVPREEPVRLGRYFSLVDITVAIVALVAIFLPPRPLEGVSAAAGTDDARFGLAEAEARVRAHPGDGAAAQELSRRLVEAKELDFAVEAPAEASQVKHAPTRWRALLATSRAYAERIEVEPAFEWGQMALNACQDAGEAACPSWEEIKVDLYTRHLDAGIKSGIDPKVDPEGFRRAGEAALRTVHLETGVMHAPEPPGPAPAPGSGSGSGSGTDGSAAPPAPAP